MRKTCLIINLYFMMFENLTLLLQCNCFGYFRLEAEDVLPNIIRMQTPKEPKMLYFVPGDLDLQTRPSEGSNTSAV